MTWPRPSLDLDLDVLGGDLPLDAAAATPSAAAVLRPRAAAVSALAPGGRTDEGEVDVDGLVEEFCLVRRVDCGAGFAEGRVLDEGVALFGGHPCQQRLDRALDLPGHRPETPAERAGGREGGGVGEAWEVGAGDVHTLT